MPINHIVNFSGGIGSWAAAKRVVAKHGKENTVLLFADTMMEDADTYRFLNEAALNVGIPLTRIADGRTPWEVFFDERYLGNSRVDPCSRILKRQLLDRWHKENGTPDMCIIHLGIDWSEIHRLHRLQEYPSDWTFEAPMCEPPFLDKEQMIAMAEAEGIERQLLYKLGFPHANCGGFCIKAGHAHFIRLLQTMPDRYAFHEGKERELRAYLGKNVTILSDRRGGKKRPMTLQELRERYEAKDPTLDYEEWGGCGCALPVTPNGEDADKDNDNEGGSV